VQATWDNGETDRDLCTSSERDANEPPCWVYQQRARVRFFCKLLASLAAHDAQVQFIMFSIHLGFPLLRPLQLRQKWTMTHRLTLLPFLDLLFAAIGIFLILIFQALTSGAEPRATAADLLLICDGRAAGGLAGARPAGAET
jgi:hypothetical protein